MKKVVVLMSTYNGEKFIEQQIKSIINQQGVDIELFIRDDGSTDKTIDIIDDYSKRFENINYYTGQNLKPAFSFLNLIMNAPSGDFYALADQDDVWECDKLEKAVDLLVPIGEREPSLYYSNLKVVDGDLNFVRNSHKKPMIQKYKYDVLLEYMPSGCTMVFNNKLKEIINHNTPSFCSMHDAWIYIIGMFFANVIYDFTPHILYRIHGNNVLGTYKKKSLKVYWLKVKRLFDRKQQPRRKNAESFLECYGDMLSTDDLKKVKEVAFYKNSLKSRFKLAFDKDFHSSSLARKVSNFLLIMFGIL